MTPIVNGLEAEYGERIAFQHLDVDEPEGRLAARAYQVRGHPTIIMIDPQGDILWKRPGVLSREEIVNAVETAIGP